MGLFSLLEEKRDSKKIAVIDRGISHTYAGLWNDVLETKHLWDARTSRKNVLIYLDNSYEFILSYFAAVSAAKNVALQRSTSGTMSRFVSRISGVCVNPSCCWSFIQ